MLNAMESVLGLLTLIGLVSTHAVGEELFRQQTDCSDFLFTDDVVFETDVFSELSCAILCANHPNCVSFTTTPGPSSTCRGHAGLVTSTSAKLASPGAVTYAAYDDESTISAEDTTESGIPSATAEDITDSGAPSAYSDVSAWLGMPCTNDTDCGDGGYFAECLMELCNCFPGCYYSLSNDTCVKNCNESDLGTRFTSYKTGKVHAAHFMDAWVPDIVYCNIECIIYGCRSYNFDPAASTCYFLNITALSNGINMSTSFDHYQRFCA